MSLPNLDLIDQGVYIVLLDFIKLTESVLVFISFQKLCAGVCYEKFMKHGFFLGSFLSYFLEFVSLT